MRLLGKFVSTKPSVVNIVIVFSHRQYTFIDITILIAYMDSCIINYF